MITVCEMIADARYRQICHLETARLVDKLVEVCWEIDKADHSTIWLRLNEMRSLLYEMEQGG